MASEDLSLIRFDIVFSKFYSPDNKKPFLVMFDQNHWVIVVVFKYLLNIYTVKILFIVDFLCKFILNLNFRKKNKVLGPTILVHKNSLSTSKYHWLNQLRFLWR